MPISVVVPSTVRALTVVQVLEEVNANTKSLLLLDQQLLERLSANSGNLLDGPFPLCCLCCCLVSLLTKLLLGRRGFD